MIFSALIILMTWASVNSFHVHNIPRKIRLNSSNTHEVNAVSSQVELWLDMRRSSIPPQTALMYLCNDLWGEYKVPDNKTFMVDVVLMNKNSDVRSICQDVNIEFEDQIRMIVLENKDAFNVDNGIISTIPMGRLISIVENEKGVVNINQNPLPVLETISEGKWSILDSNSEESNASTNAISGILQLASYGMSSFGNGSSDNIKGGIAVTCCTETDVLNVCAFVQSLLGTNYKQTDSGILVQSIDARSQSSTDGIKYAIVIPFDASLWKTASFLFQ